MQVEVKIGIADELTRTFYFIWKPNVHEKVAKPIVKKLISQKRRQVRKNCKRQKKYALDQHITGGIQ